LQIYSIQVYMKRKTILAIIVLTSISLIGLVATQLQWLHHAIKIAEEQYDHRVTVALQNVEYDLRRMQEKHLKHAPNEVCIYCRNTRFKIATPDTLLLDSLISVHFDYQKLDTCYRYALFKDANDTVVYKSTSLVSEPLRLSEHKACLNCLSQYREYKLAVFFPMKQRFLFHEMASWIGASTLFICIIIFSFIFVIYGIIKQKKLSEMKSDFVNNMTHELKTPISTIALASEVLMKADKASSVERLIKYSHIIHDETLRLQNLVEQVLQTATMGNAKIKLKIQQFNMHDLIKSTVNNLCIEQCEKPVNLTFAFNAKIEEINADRLHITNVIVNLVQNAIKYSGDNPDITISTENCEKYFVFLVADNGEGLSKDVQQKVFEKFYRVPKGNIHNVKGYGLGLFYVKSTVEAHGGSVFVSSTPGHGSKFIVKIPLELHVC